MTIRDYLNFLNFDFKIKLQMTNSRETSSRKEMVFGCHHITVCHFIYC